MTENAETIKANSLKPKTVEADGQKVEAHPIPDQIAADKYAESTKAAKRRGLVLTKLSPPGTQ